MSVELNKKGRSKENWSGLKNQECSERYICELSRIHNHGHHQNFISDSSLVQERLKKIKP